MTPARMPMMSAAIGVTKPAAGVTATRPATAPEAPPSIVGLPLRIHSAAIQPSVAAAAAVLVLTKAGEAGSLEDTALAAVNPNHPTHNNEAPITEKGAVCRGTAEVGEPPRS